MALTEFQPNLSLGIITDAIDTPEKLIAVIRQVVTIDGSELSQGRLAEILIRLAQFTSGTVVTTSPGLSNVNLSYNNVDNALTLSVGSMSNTFPITENHGAFSNTIIPVNATTKVALLALEAAINALAVSGGSGSSYNNYDAGNGVFVWASGPGVSTAWNAGEITVTIPLGIKLLGFTLALSNGSNVQALGDASGATNWIRVRILGTTGYNTTKENMQVPLIQKTFYTSSNPSLGSAYSIDIDNNPNMAVVGVGSNSITIRIWNLIIPNGAQFSFSKI